MQGILMLILGLVAGGTIGVVIMALLSASKQADLEHEKLMAYKDGYQKGYDDGYALKQSHMK
jgi:hypothetical protein